MARFVKYEKQNISNAFESFKIKNYRSPAGLRLNATTSWESRQSPCSNGLKTLQSRLRRIYSQTATSQIQIIIIEYPVKGKSITREYDVNGSQGCLNDKVEKKRECQKKKIKNFDLP